MGEAITSWILKIITLIFSIKQQTNQLYNQEEEKINNIFEGEISVYHLRNLSSYQSKMSRE